MLLTIVSLKPSSRSLCPNEQQLHFYYPVHFEQKCSQCIIAENGMCQVLNNEKKHALNKKSLIQRETGLKMVINWNFVLKEKYIMFENKLMLLENSRLLNTH